MPIGTYATSANFHQLRDTTIEAPLRLYITENPDGMATLSYKTAAHVFAPYMEEGGPELMALAAEFDQILTDIAAQATGG